jgi:hypothetical protein
VLAGTSANDRHTSFVRRLPVQASGLGPPTCTFSRQLVVFLTLPHLAPIVRSSSVGCDRLLQSRSLRLITKPKPMIPEPNKTNVPGSGVEP